MRLFSSSANVRFRPVRIRRSYSEEAPAEETDSETSRVYFAGVNKAIIVGTCGASAKLSKSLTPGATAPHFARFPLATNDIWKDATTGELQSRVEWHKVVVRFTSEEIASKFASRLTKGSRVYVEGSIRSRSYDDPQHAGITRSVTEIWASSRDIKIVLRKEVDGEATAVPEDSI